MTQSIYSDLDTVRDWVRYGATLFNQAKLYFGHGTDNEWDEALYLMLHAINQPWQRVDDIIDCNLTLSEKQAVHQLYQARIERRVPAAYLTGRAWFCGFEFEVNEHVLVPRSPIAELIQTQFAPWLVNQPVKILDMCTGSGCIGIATALHFDEAFVDCVDISPEAIAIAKKNIDRYGLEARVEAIVSDGFSQLKQQKYDLIVSNPPYVDAQDLASMPEEFRAEPKLGLASGQDGLDFTRRLMADAANYLSEDGLLVVEVGNSWVALENAFPQMAFTWPEFENGGHGVFVLTRSQLITYKQNA